METGAEREVFHLLAHMTNFKTGLLFIKGMVFRWVITLLSIVSGRYPIFLHMTTNKVHLLLTKIVKHISSQSLLNNRSTY